jgi:hypothetical protein
MSGNSDNREDMREASHDTVSTKSSRPFLSSVLEGFAGSHITRKEQIINGFAAKSRRATGRSVSGWLLPL